MFFIVISILVSLKNRHCPNYSNGKGKYKLINVRQMELPVDIKAEIEDFDWNRPNWKGDRLIACSPFRNEKHPSFAVNLENGTFIDSGNDDEEFRKGNFVKLLSWIRGESYEETEEYLIALYSPYYGDIENMELVIDDWFDDKEEKKTFDRSKLTPYLYKHPYLERRGIPFNVQRAFDVGYDPKTKSVVLVWHDKDGNIVSWKHRNIHNKLFWYVKGGQPIRNHLYGIHWVTKKKSKRVWIVESEIDALTLWSKGIHSVAIGTSYLSKAKRDLIVQSTIEELVIATDNDKQGTKARNSIVNELAGRVHLDEIDWDNLSYNDINDARDQLDELHIEEVDVFVW